MHFMLQKEVVDRMVAAPGGKDYGRLDGDARAAGSAWNRCSTSAPGRSRRRPRSISTFFALHPYASPPFAIHDHAVFAKVVLAAFGQRRKTLRNSLAGLMDAAAIAAAGVDPGARPETLAPAQFAALAAQSGPENHTDLWPAPADL